MFGSLRRGRSRRLVRIAKGLPLLVAVLASFVVFAPAAFANSATLVASASCPEAFAPNTYTIDFSSNSWTSGLDGSNPDIHVEYSVNSGPFQLGEQFAFPNEATVPSQSGSFVVSNPGPITSLVVRVAAFANWGQGNTSRGPWDQQQVTLPRGCQPPASPTAGASIDCSAGGAVVTVRNGAPEGGESVMFTVSAAAGTSPAFSQTTTAIGPSGSTTVFVPFAENETRTIVVTAPYFTKSLTLTRDCQRPGAEVTDTCAPSGLDVTVTNTGDDEGVFSINGVSQSVAAGASFTSNVAVAEGASVQVDVLLDGTPVPGSPFTFLRDCQHPAAAVSHTSAPSGLDVTVTNTGDDEGMFSINGVSQTVAAGASFTSNVAVAEGASVQVDVLLDGSPVEGSPFTFARDCEQPAALAGTSCARTGADVVLGNSGPSPTTLTVTENGTLIDTVVVPGFTAVRRIYPLVEDEIATFRVVGAGFDSGDLNVSRDCVEVGGVIVVRAPTPPTTTALAFTGASSQPIALTGFLLLGLGGLALVASRRRSGQPMR